MSDPTPSAPTFPSPHRRMRLNQESVSTPVMRPALTPLHTPVYPLDIEAMVATPQMMPVPDMEAMVPTPQMMPLPDNMKPMAEVPEPALTPVRAPTRRFVVKTLVSPEAQAEIAAHQKAQRDHETAATIIGMAAPILPPPDIANAQTIIGMAAPILPPADLVKSPSGRSLDAVKTVVKRPKSNPPRIPIQEMTTDPMRVAPAPLPNDTLRPSMAVPVNPAAPTLPPNNGIAPARLDDATLLPMKSPFADVSGDATLLPMKSPFAPAADGDLTLLPMKSPFADAKIDTAPPATKVVMAKQNDADLNWPREQRRRRLLWVVGGIAAIAVGVGLGALIKRQLNPNQPQQSAIVEIKQ